MNRKYKIKPVSPSLSPYTVLIGKLLKTEPKTVEEAEQLSTQIQAAMEKVFEKTVSPKPAIEDYIVVYNQIIEKTNAELEKAGFFRQHQQPDIKKSGTVSDNDKQASQ